MTKKARFTSSVMASMAVLASIADVPTTLPGRMLSRTDGATGVPAGSSKRPRNKSDNQKRRKAQKAARKRNR